MSSIKTAQTKRLVTMDMSRYLFGQTPQFARADADADDMSKHQKHCVWWDKMHMSMIMAFILQRAA